MRLTGLLASLAIAFVFCNEVIKSKQAMAARLSQCLGISAWSPRRGKVFRLDGNSVSSRSEWNEYDELEITSYAEVERPVSLVWSLKANTMPVDHNDLQCHSLGVSTVSLCLTACQTEIKLDNRSSLGIREYSSITPHSARRFSNRYIGTLTMLPNLCDRIFWRHTTKFLPRPCYGVSEPCYC
jgi:hypothetical protein